MSRLLIWLHAMETLHQQRNDTQWQALKQLLIDVPRSVFGPDLNDNQSKAIAYFLDGCLRLFQHQQTNQPDAAFQYLQFAYAKLQQTSADPLTDLIIKDWCMKRLQHLIVLSLEFCQQQDQTQWHAIASGLIDAHVSFMASLSWNDDQGLHAILIH
ncbi:transcriptional regulator [Vibrio aestuarianus]|nr:transcriptional regulator [Vibrio aestuarianus]MDE1351978.1 transcriptional regulator [Vibrio aestuarianus]